MHAVVQLLTHEHLCTRIATASALSAACLADDRTAMLCALCDRVIALRLASLERLLPAYCMLWAACQVLSTGHGPHYPLPMHPASAHTPYQHSCQSQCKPVWLLLQSMPWRPCLAPSLNHGRPCTYCCLLTWLLHTARESMQAQPAPRHHHPHRPLCYQPP